MKNRIVTAIAAAKNQIEKRVADGLVTQEKVEEARKQLDMDLNEYVKFQELKSLAVATGKLSLDEGMTIYNVLGEAGPEHFNAQPIEVKHVLTQIFMELIQARIKAA